jgi:hypothetical protein
MKRTRVDFEKEIDELPDSQTIQNELHERRVDNTKRYILNKIKKAIENNYKHVFILFTEIYSHDEVIEFISNICKKKKYICKQDDTSYAISFC